ncbi:MAG: class I SAM-dependent methyltransferase [Dehalococcoidia bacterium]
MSHLNEALSRVREAFDRDPSLEWQRLDVFPRSRLEYFIVSAVLQRHLPPPSPLCQILDAGGGPGRYTVALAAEGYRVTLLDLSSELLRLARQRLVDADADIQRNVIGIVEGSITDLSPFPDGHFSAVLCLGGVLSFLLDPASQRGALSELIRVTRPGGLLFITVLNRFGGYRGALECPPSPDSLAGIQRMAETGIRVLEMLQVPAYWFLPEEFTALLTATGLEIEQLYGVHGIAAHASDEYLGSIMADPEQWRVWSQLLLDTCNHPTVYGLSYHLLAVARRPHSRRR